jgi:hypothetical protein
MRGFLPLLSSLCSVMLFNCSPLVFSGVRVTRSLVLCVCFVDRCLSFCPFFSVPLCCLSFFELRIQIISSGIFKFVSLLFGTSDCCQNVIFIFFRHCVIHHDCEDDKPFQLIELICCIRENRWDNQEWTIQK